MPSSKPMTRLALRLLLFVLPLLLCWGGLEYWVRGIPTSHSIKRHNLQGLTGEIDTLILGSSSAYWDIAPAYLPGSVYNLANVAQTPYYDDRLAALVVPELPQLRRVIIAIPYVSLFFQLQGTDEEERQYYYYQEWGIPPPRIRERLDPRMLSAVALHTPEYAVDSLRVALTGLAKGRGFNTPPVDPPIDARGWCPRAPGDPNDLTVPVVEKKLAYHHGLMHFSDEAANLAALDHLLEMLRERHVEVILVTPPVWPAYAERMRKDYWQRAQTDLTQLSARYGARYLSFLDAPLPAEDFLDADHLNRDGAVRFTQLLASAISGGVH